MSLIAVTGATGQLGRIVIEKLKETEVASKVVALARDPKKAESLGVTARTFDYSKPETLEAGLAQVGTLLLISGSEVGQRLAQHSSVINAAKKAGVKRIVYTSLLRADTSPLDLAPEHKATEAALKESGLAYTILRNGWYTENYLTAVGAALQYGAIIGSAGEGRVSSASREDFADAAVAVLLKPEGHENGILELAGDSFYTLAELAAELAKQSGNPVAYNNLPEADYATALKGFGLPAAFAAILAQSDVSASKGALYSEDRTLSKLIGHPTTPLSKSVEQAIKAL